MPPESLISLATGAGGAAFVALWIAWMFSTHKWHSHEEFSAEETRRVKAEEANERLQRALELANARADTGVRAAEIATGIFEALEHRQHGEVTP